MNFKFDEDEQKVIDMIHEFGVNHVAPLAAEIDEQERFPEENRKILAELGMMGTVTRKNTVAQNILILPILR